MSEPNPPHIKNLLTTYVNINNFYTEPIIDVQNHGQNDESTANTSTEGQPMMAHITPPYCANPVSNAVTREQFFGHAAAGLPSIAHITPPYCANPVSNVATREQFFGHAMSSDSLAKFSMTTPNPIDHSSREPKSQFPIMCNDFRSPYRPSFFTAPPQHNYVLPNLLPALSSSENVGDSIEVKMRQLRQGFGGLSPTTDSFEPANCSRNSSTIDSTTYSLGGCSIEESSKDCTAPSHQLLSQQFAYGDSTDGGSTNGVSTEMVLVASSSFKCEKMSCTENAGRDGDQMVLCSACPHLHFMSITLFYKHYVTEHINERKIQCEKCPRKFRSPVNFRNHLRDFHSDCNVFKCPECPTEFPRQHDFTLHYRRIHLELPPIQCNICREEFTYHTALDIHMKNVHSIEEP